MRCSVRASRLAARKPKSGSGGAVMAQGSLPSISAGENGLNRYLAEIRRFPMLEPQEEYMLAKRFLEHEDTKAAHKLVTSHLRLVAKIAMGYRGYGLPIGEVISEGNVGLMQAVKKFDPERGFPAGHLRHVVDQGPRSRNTSCARGASSRWAPPPTRSGCSSTCARSRAAIQAVDDGDLRPRPGGRDRHQAECVGKRK